MEMKYKIINTVAKLHRLFVYGISLAIIYSIGTIVGMIDNNMVIAAKPLTMCGLNCTINGEGP